MIDMLLFLAVALASAQDAPDYDSPYSPIFTDKQAYTWTDMVQVRIVAPSWNEDRHAVDSIGGTADHAVTISTREGSLGPYRLVETDVNSGVFTAEVVLTGFPHDVDGDGYVDTAPRTGGGGPADGFLEAGRDSAVTISFEFADGVILTESVPVEWNVGTVRFSGDSYLQEGRAGILLADPDLNLNPKAVDRAPVRVWSDSDSAGIDVIATETGRATGVFEGDVFFSSDRPTSGARLHAVPGDVIYAEYEDRTLPAPHAESDVLAVVDRASLGGAPLPGKVTSRAITFADGSGNTLEHVSPHDQVQILGGLENDRDFVQPFVFLVQVKDESGAAVSISWLEGELAAGQGLAVSQSWVPQDVGAYGVDAFAWSSLSEAVPLAPPQHAPLHVR